MYQFFCPPQHKTRRINLKGYTLLELLVVMMIIAIVFGVTTASYRTFQRRQYIEAKARDVLADVRLAQEFGLAGKVEGCPAGTYMGHAIVGTPQQNRYSINTVCSNGTPNPDFLSPYKEVVVPEGLFVQVRNMNDGDRAIIFEPLSGGINRTNGFACIYIRSGDTTSTPIKRISVSPTGVVDFVSSLCMGT